MSLYFVQSVTETIASRAPALDGLSPLRDKANDLVLVGAQAYCVYLDNLGVTAKTQQEANIVLEQWKKQLFTENGLSLHKSALSQKDTNPWALSWTDLSLCCRVSSKRFWTLRRALDEFLRRRKITRRALEHCRWSYQFLASRCQTCAMHTADVVSFHARAISRGDSPLDRNTGRTVCGSGTLDFLPK